MPSSRHSVDRAIALWTLGKLSSTDLPAVAWDALELGFDGPAIRRLAALERPSHFEVGDLFQDAILEMSISPCSKKAAAVFLAREIAQEILSGSKEPLSGAYEIWLLCYLGGCPEEIMVFGGLDQEFDIPQVLKECKALVSQ